MKRILRILILPAALATLLFSCVREKVPTGPRTPGYKASSVPLEARADLPEGWKPFLGTRAPEDITLVIADTTLQRLGFGVYAFYTGEEEFSSSTDSSAYDKFGLVLNKRLYSYSSSAWHNSGTAEFWPATTGEKLSAFAFAPYADWASHTYYNGKTPYIVYDDFVAQSLTETELSKQRDLLWGTNTSGMPHKNVEKTQYTPEGAIDFHFRHATAKVSFQIQGILPGETRTRTSDGVYYDESSVITSTENGTSNTSSDVQNQTGLTINGQRYYATKTETQTETYEQTQYLTVQQRDTTIFYTVQGTRYMIDSVTFKGFNKTGTLLLDNASAYESSWTSVTRFPGPGAEYVLTNVAGNALTQGLRKVSTSVIQNNFGTYTGIKDSPTDLMGGYFIYAVPRTSSVGDYIALRLRYYKLEINGTAKAQETRTVYCKQTRLLTRTRTRSVTSQRRNNNSSDISRYTFNTTLENTAWGEWGQWTDPPFGDPIVLSEDESVPVSERLVSSTVTYDANPVILKGNVVSSLLGGRSYTINLIVAGDKIELTVVPHPWQLQEYEFNYNAEINDAPQNLTYDSSTIDYRDGEYVYINNRVARFFFSLTAGKYTAWQASLIGDPAFGFTDENGDFLLDAHGNRVTSIRHGIEPEILNNIYIRAIDSSSSVTSKAKLRIYYIDASGNAVAALNLVKQDGVTEWTVVQNAN